MPMNPLDNKEPPDNKGGRLPATYRPISKFG